MLELTGNTRLCYFEPLDQFIRIRSFTEAEVGTLLRGVQLTGRRSYVQFVINTVVVDYNDKVLPALRAKPGATALGTHSEERLFAVCVDVNPALALDRVSAYLTAETASPLVFVGEAPASENASPVSREKLLALEDELGSRIIGQEEAIRVVADAVRKAYVGFRDEEKPVGNFLFVGPTGVGKTELARTLARFLFQESDGLVRIDCSEYAQPHEYAKLIGSPPGYIGHDDGGQLTEALKRRSHVVVLFDEIEKADARVHNLLLQILDDGVVSDSKGTRVSFKNAIIVLTSNIGTREVGSLGQGIGFVEEAVSEQDRRRASSQAVESFFRPEFVNRIDEVILFRGFTAEEALRVVEVMLSDVQARLAGRGITLVFANDVSEFLAERGINTRYGARPLRRAIKRLVESPLASYVLERDITGGTIHTQVRDGALAFS